MKTPQIISLLVFRSNMFQKLFNYCSKAEKYTSEAIYVYLKKEGVKIKKEKKVKFIFQLIYKLQNMLIENCTSFKHVTAKRSLFGVNII